MLDKFATRVNTAGDKGISWLVSWMLYLILSVFPALYLRNFSKKQQVPWLVELYVSLKMIFVFLVLAMSWYKHPVILLVIVLLLIETVLYNLFFILCSNLFEVPVSPKRLLILGFINYLEIVFSFACIYASMQAIVYATPNIPTPLTKVDYTFFSVAIGGVLGFGDYKIINETGKTLAVLQCMIFLMFFILFISYNLSLFTSKKEPFERNPG